MSSSSELDAGAAMADVSPAIDLTLDEMMAMGGRGHRLHPHRDADSVFHGDLLGRRPGSGMELDSVGPYEAGDDVRHIDWLASARTGRTQVRRFRTEFQWTVVLVVDMRASMFFGSRGQLLAKTACLAAAKFGFDLAPYHQRLGWICLTDNGPIRLTPQRGRRTRVQQLQQIVSVYRRACAHAREPVTPLDSALAEVCGTIRGDAQIVFLSDFSFLGKTLARRMHELGPRRMSVVVIEDVLLDPPLPKGAYPVREMGEGTLLPAAIGRRDDAAHGIASAKLRRELDLLLRDLGVRQLVHCDHASLDSGVFR